MPAQELSHRRQDALLWPATPGLAGVDAYGEPTGDRPVVELKVRWVWKRRQATSPQGNQVMTDVTVIADRYVLPGGAMWEGSLAEWLGTGSGAEDAQVMEVVSCNSTPDLKARVVEYEVGLAFYKTVTPPAT